MPKKPLIIEQFVYSLFYPAVLGSFLFYIFDWDKILAQESIFTILLFSVIALFCLDYFYNLLTMHRRDDLNWTSRFLVSAFDLFTVFFFRLSFEAIEDISNHGLQEHSTTLVNVALVVCTICTVAIDLILKQFTLSKVINSTRKFLLPIIQIIATIFYAIYSLSLASVPDGILTENQMSPAELADNVINAAMEYNTPFSWFTLLAFVYFAYYVFLIISATPGYLLHVRAEKNCHEESLPD